MAEVKDYYRILGVSETASEDEIKRAYRRLAKKHHPDANPSSRKSSEEKFKEISAAYDVLSDPQKRRQYDEIRRYGGSQGIPFEEMYRRQAAGQGEGVHVQNGDAGAFGDLFEQLFREGGFRWNATGGATPDEEEVVSENDGFFRRRGLDVYCEVPISVTQAALGARLRVRAYSTNGRVELKVPPGTQPGTTFRLRGLGAKSGRRSGDQFIMIRVIIPRSLTPRQRELLEELEKESRSARR